MGGNDDEALHPVNGEVTNSAWHIVGVPCIDAEKELLQSFARDRLDARQSLRAIEAA